MLIAAIILIAPSYIITRSVEPIGILRRTDQNQSDEILYSIATAKFAQNDYWTYALLALNLFNGFILYNVLLCINILVIIRFKQKKANNWFRVTQHFGLLNILQLLNNIH
jgi:hypothetical protein